MVGPALLLVAMLPAADPEPRLKLEASDGVVYVVYADGGKLLRVFGAQDTLREYDTTTGKLLRTPKRERAVGERLVAGSSDGKWALIAGGDGADSLWDLSTGKASAKLDKKLHAYRNPLPGPPGGEQLLPPFTAGFSSDGTRVAGGTAAGAVTDWDAATGKAEHTLEVGFEVSSVAPSADGKLLLTGHSTKSIQPKDRNVVVAWDTKTGKALREWKGCDEGGTKDWKYAHSDAWGLFPLADGTTVLFERQVFYSTNPLPGQPGTPPLSTAGYRLRVLDPTGRRIDKAVELPHLTGTPSVTPDGKLAAYVSSLLTPDRKTVFEVNVVDLATGKITASLPAPKGTEFALFRPDGKEVVVGARNSALAVWLVEDFPRAK